MLCCLLLLEIEHCLDIFKDEIYLITPNQEQYRIIGNVRIFFLRKCLRALIYCTASDSKCNGSLMQQIHNASEDKYIFQYFSTGVIFHGYYSQSGGKILLMRCLPRDFLIMIKKYRLCFCWLISRITYLLGSNAEDGAQVLKYLK
jgi:hypothetical protein